MAIFYWTQKDGKRMRNKDNTEYKELSENTQALHEASLIGKE